MRRLTKTFVALTWLIGPGWPAVGQEYRGAFHLKVLSAEGAPVVAAEVTLTGSAASRVQQTSAAGVARFRKLEPGEYTVEVQKPAFHTTVLTGVKIATATDVEMEVRLQHAGIVERVVVRSQTPLVDRRETSVRTVVSPEEISSLPTTRDPWAVLSTVPGVQIELVDVGGSQSGIGRGHASKGSRSTDTTWIIDGVEITNMAATGSTPMLYDFNSFREIGITTGGGDVDQLTAGVQLSFVTKQGTNRHTGAVGLILADGELQSSPPDYQQPDGTPLRSNEVDRAFERYFEFGGPIESDKAWYWVGLSANDVDRGLPGPGETQVKESQEWRNLTGKINGVVGIRGTYKVFLTDYDKTAFGSGAGPTRPPETSVDREIDTPVFAVDLGWFFSRNLEMTLQYGHVGKTSRNRPQGTAGQILWDSDFVFHNTWMTDGYEEPTEQLAVRGNYFLDSGNVAHELTFGYRHREAEFEFSRRWGEQNVIAVEWSDSCGTPDPGPEPNYCGEAWVCATGVSHVSAEYDSLWAGDTILWNNWAFKVGALWMIQDGRPERVVAPASELCPTCLPEAEFGGSDPGFEWNDVLPRVGLTYSFGTSRPQLVKAGWARYADQLGIAHIDYGESYGVPREIDYPWTDLNQDRLVQADEVDFDTVLWANVNPDDPTTVEPLHFIDTDYRAPRTDELILGYQMEPMRDLSVGITYAHRRRDRESWTPIVDLTTVTPGADTSTYGTLDSSFWVAQPEVTGTVACYSDAGPCYLDGQGEEYSVTPYALNDEGVARTNTARSTILTNRPGYSEDFDGVELAVTKRLSDRWMLRGHLAWQQWTKNVSPSAIQNPANLLGDTALDGSSTVKSGYRGVFWGTADWSYNVNFLHQMPLNLSVSGNLNGRRGFVQPLYRQVWVSDADGLWNRQNLQIHDADRYRYDDTPLLDLRLSWTARIFRDTALELSLEGFNVLNDDTILSVDAGQAVPTSGNILEVQSPRIFRVGARFTI